MFSIKKKFSEVQEIFYIKYFGMNGPMKIVHLWLLKRGRGQKDGAALLALRRGGKGGARLMTGNGVLTRVHDSSFLATYRLLKKCKGSTSTRACAHSVVSDSLWPHGSSGHGILQARILEWVAISSSGGSFWPRGLLRLLHWWADSLPLSHLGSPVWAQDMRFPQRPGSDPLPGS